MQEIDYNSPHINKLIEGALREDACHADATSFLVVPHGKICEGVILVKEEAVICGLKLIKKIFQKLDKTVRIRTMFRDGQRVKANTKLAFLKGKARALLQAERTALNFLGHLSGIATNTERYIQKIRPLKTKIFDTRKTTPSLRLLEKYAVRCGGGYNHRFDLRDMILIKDNHRCLIEETQTLSQFLGGLRLRTAQKTEIEVDNLDQFHEVLKTPPEMILLDNMKTKEIKRAVDLVRRLPASRRPILEASGGITLQNVRRVARTGVDRIAVGALTHTHRMIDVSLELCKR